MDVMGTGSARIRAERRSSAGEPLRRSPAQSGGWPYRWYFVPVGMAAGLWTAAVACGLWSEQTPTAIATTVVGVLGLVAVRFGLSRLRDRAIVWAAILFAASWLLAATAERPWDRQLLAWLAAATLAGMLPWCRHRWTRQKVRTDTDLRQWPERADRLGIAGAVLYEVEWTGVGRKLLIELASGQTWRQVRAETAESVLDVAPGAVTVERDRHVARRLVLHVQDVDPWDGDGDGLQGIAHPILPVLPTLQSAAAEAAAVAVEVGTGLADGPASLPAASAEPDAAAAESERVSARLASLMAAVVGVQRTRPEPAVAWWAPGSGTVTEPLEIGVSPDLTPAALPIWRKSAGALHWLVGGATGAGKSVFYRDLITSLARCRDVIILGIDIGKKGKVFTPWAPVMTGIASDLPSAVAMLRGVLRIVETSAATSAQEAAEGVGEDNVEPSPDRPQVVVIVDEGADLLDVGNANPNSVDGHLRFEAVELCERLGAKGRSEAVSLVFGTQRPDNSSLGGSGILRTHCTVGVCLRMKNPSDIRFVLQSESADELDVSLFRHPGLLYAQDGPETVPYPIRSYAVLSPAESRAIADVLAPGMTTPPDWMNQLLNAKETTMPNKPHEPAMPASGDDGSSRPVLGGRADVRAKIAAYQAEVDAEAAAEAETGTGVPDIPLAQLAFLHQSKEVVEPGDDAARTAILSALTDAGLDGMQRAEIEATTGVDSAVCQRLLAAAERSGAIEGEPGTGPQIRWRQMGRPRLATAADENPAEIEGGHQ